MLAQGHKPYLVPYGGSNSTGALGYVFAMEEFVGQAVKADWIVFASSSGGTQAGLVLGAHLFNYPGKLLGISVDEPQPILAEACCNTGLRDLRANGAAYRIRS